MLDSVLTLVCLCVSLQLFYSFFKTLMGKEIAVELKNDVAVMGTLHSVDQYLNIKLLNVSVVEGEKFPQLVRVNGRWHAHSLSLYRLLALGLCTYAILNAYV